VKNTDFLSLLLFFVGFGLFGQPAPTEYKRWFLKPAAGINIPITNLFSGEVTDPLIEYDNNTYYWQLISGNYFINEKWGIEFTFQTGESTRRSDRVNRFYTDMQNTYNDNFYVVPFTPAQYSEPDIFGGSIERSYLGIVYRIQNSKILLLPKFLIGITSFYTDWGKVTLKEKGTNTVFKLSYSTGKRPSDHFTIASSFTFGYRLSKFILANVDVIYSFFKPDIVFSEEIRNTYTEELVSRSIVYNKNIHTITIGAGIIIELRTIRKK